MRRPKWIAALAFALIVAGGFAWLGQWQMDIAIRTDDPDVVSFEEVRPLSEVAGPGESVTDLAGAAVVETVGSFVPGDFRVVETRVNQGDAGVWVTGHFVTSQGHLPVAVGWAETVEQAYTSIETLDGLLSGVTPDTVLEGRYMPPEAAMVPRSDGDPQRQITMVPGYQVNTWESFDGPTYAGFLVMHPEGTESFNESSLSDAGLETIDSFPPLPVETVNWLNVFYAIEWVVFGGFAIFFWYRLARDEWEKEHEIQLMLQAENETSMTAATS